MMDKEAICRANPQLSPDSSEVIRAGIQLCPGVKTFRYIAVQIQDMDPYTEVMNGCGPLALVNFWCLAKGFYPHSFPRVSEVQTRTRMKRMLENDVMENFFQSTSSKALMIPKEILLVYERTYDMSDTNFNLTQRKYD